MARVQYSNVNRLFWDLFHFDDYDTVRMTRKKIVLEYGDAATDAHGAYDINGGRAFRLELDLKNVAYKVPSQGPFAGLKIAKKGIVTGFTAFNDQGDVLVSASGFSAALRALQKDYLHGDGWGMFVKLYSDPLRVFGADETGVDWYNGDDIRTGFGNDIVHANKGADWIIDYGGRDKYFGGAGFDKLGYAFIDLPQIERGVLANLRKGWVIGPDNKKDMIVSIEGISGTNIEDKMIGDAKSNSFRGFGGDDVFRGGGGFDWVMFRDDARSGGTNGVVVNLREGWAIDGFGDRDTFRSVEGSWGTDEGDVFFDSDKDNSFTGKDGDDVFHLSLGRDYCWGGAGADTFIFEGDAFGENTIGDFEDGTDKIQIAEITNLTDVTIADDGDDKLISWNGNTIRLLDAAGTTIDADDFVF